MLFSLPFCIRDILFNVVTVHDLIFVWLSPSFMEDFLHKTIFSTYQYTKWNLRGKI